MGISESNSLKINQTPYDVGYRMPAEWEPHEATWLAWPNPAQPWLEGRFEAVRDIYLQMIETLLPYEGIHLLVRSHAEEESVRTFLKPKIRNLQPLSFHHAEVSDIWIRDYGPTFIKRDVDNGKAWCKWHFNAWGGKYPDLIKDSEVFNKGDFIDEPCFPADMVFEGGAIGVNGRGIGIATKACLLNKNRNPHLTRSEIESNLKNFLGIEHLIWLEEGISGDDTDGHIDDAARFVSEDKIVACWEEHAEDPNHLILKRNWELLKENSKEPLERIKLPMPGIVAERGHRLPATYANFYIANEVVLVPTYGQRQDSDAIHILKDLFKPREVVPIRSSALIYGLGSLHCVTQQEPA